MLAPADELFPEAVLSLLAQLIAPVLPPCAGPGTGTHLFHSEHHTRSEVRLRPCPRVVGIASRSTASRANRATKADVVCPLPHRQMNMRGQFPSQCSALKNDDAHWQQPTIH